MTIMLANHFQGYEDLLNLTYSTRNERWFLANKNLKNTGL